MSEQSSDQVPRRMFTAQLDENMWRQLKAVAAIEDKRIYVVLEEAIRDYLDKKANGPPVLRRTR